MIKKIAKPKKIKTRFMLVMIFSSVLPLILIGTLSYFISNVISFRQTVSIYNDNLQVYNHNLDRVFDDIANKMRGVLVMDQTKSATTSIIDILQATHREAFANQRYYTTYYYYYLMDQTIKTIINEDYNIMGAFLWNGTSFQYYKDYRGSQSKYYLTSTQLNEITDTLWYKKALEKRGAEIFIGADVFQPYIFSGEKTGAFTCWKLLIDPVHFKPVGHLSFSVNKQILEETLPMQITIKGSSYAIVDNTLEKPVLVFQSGTIENLASIIQTHYQGIENKDWIIGSTQNKTSGWDIFYVLNKDEVYKSSNTIGKITFIITIIVTIINILIFLLLNRSIMAPLYKLLKMILQVGVDENIEVKENFKDDEIGSIGTEFKILINDNLRLKQNLYLSLTKQKEAEIKALQAQINPHFLYNTLDSMYWMAKIKGQDELADITISLSDIFRFSLDRGERFVFLADEIENIKKYLLLQKKRFGERISYEVTVDPEVLKCKILKLLVQPIVENALYHGLEEKIESGYLSICAEKVGDCLKISVQDNGVGMDVTKEQFKGFGITNIEERIVLYYGTPYGITFKSQLQKGTVVTILLPLVYDSY